MTKFSSDHDSIYQTSEMTADTKQELHYSRVLSLASVDIETGSFSAVGAVLYSVEY